MQEPPDGRLARSVPGGSPQRLFLPGDAALAAVLATGSAAIAALQPGLPHRDVLVLLSLLQTLPLAFRRRYPLRVLAIVVAASCTAAIASGTLIEPLALLVAVYSTAAHSRRRDAIRAGAVTGVVLLWPLLRNADYRASAAAIQLGLLAAAWITGAYLGELRARAAANHREQELHTARAIAEEQARVGRELHDIIAHTLSVIIVQAAAAGDVFDARPDQARQALSSIEAAGRQALLELRHMLAVVRAAEQPGPPAPQPGLAQLDTLTAQARAAGLTVTARVDGNSRGLPAQVDISAYRIVQEALTNTIKHARANTAEVSISYHPRELMIDVTDDGTGAGPVAGLGSGRGLIGMRERVALHGGTLTAGPQQDRGFRVQARFPLPPKEPPS